MEPGEKSPPLDLKGGRYASLTASVEALELELGSLGERLVRLMGSAEMGALQLPPEDVEVEALAVLQALLGVSSAVGSTEATLVEALRELLPPGWLQRSPGQLSNLGDAIDRMGFSHVWALPSPALDFHVSLNMYMHMCMCMCMYRYMHMYMDKSRCNCMCNCMYI